MSGKRPTQRGKKESWRSLHQSYHKASPPGRCGCFDKLGIAKISAIFDNFWKLDDHALLNAQIASSVKSEKMKRCRVKDRPPRTKHP